MAVTDCMIDEKKSLYPDETFVERAHISGFEQYEKMYQASVENPDGFWLKQAKTLDWMKEPSLSIVLRQSLVRRFLLYLKKRSMQWCQIFPHKNQSTIRT